MFVYKLSVIRWGH